MAKHSKDSCQTNQARKQRKVKPMPLTRQVEKITQTVTWVCKYESLVKERLSTDNGETSLLNRDTFFHTLDLLRVFKVNEGALLFKLHRMVNMVNGEKIEGAPFYTYASLAPVLKEIIYMELIKLGPIKKLIKKINWNRLRLSRD